MEKLEFMKRRDGFLNGQLLIAMPGMKDERFNRSVIYICAHSDEGAMGIILNKRQELDFSELLVQLGLVSEEDSISLPHSIQNVPVRNGGPVAPSKGFVLHSDDFNCDSTLPLSDDISLTATVDVLKAISLGQGPENALVALGYAGWAPGQLEAEISANGWLTGNADSDLLFKASLESQYDQSLLRIGVDPTFLVADIGHA